MSFSSQDFDSRRSQALATFEETDRESQERSFSVIDQFSRFDGTFVAERDLRVDGEVKGTINCHGTLFVAQGAVVSASIEAENITVAGELTGEIRCRGRLRLLPSGKLKGKVRTRAMVVAEGAIYDGDLVMEAPAAGANGSAAAAETAPALEPSPANRTPSTPRRSSRSSGTAPPQPSRPARTEEPAAPSTFIRRLGGPETPWEEPEQDSATRDTDHSES